MSTPVYGNDFDSEDGRYESDNMQYTSDPADDSSIGPEIEYQDTTQDSPSGTDAPDPIETDPSRFYDRRIIPSRRINTITSRRNIFGDSQCRLIAPPNPNRHRIRTFTDTNNTGPVYISNQYTSDVTAAIAFTPSSDWFPWDGTGELYAWSVSNNFLYVVEEEIR